MESYNKSYDAIYDSHSLLFEQYTADLSLANTSNLVYINQESTEQQKPCQNTAHSNSTMFSYFLATVSFLLVIAWNTRFRGNLRFIYNYTSFIIYLAGFGASFMLLVGLLRPRNPRNVSVAVRLLRFAERFLSFRVTSLGAQNIPKDDSFILICNHQSMFDTVALSSVWPEKCVVIMKKSLMYSTGIFGLASWLNGSLFINRTKQTSAFRTCQNAVDTMLKKKIRVIVFPEGTRHLKGDHLLPFKKGSFHMAKQGNNLKLVPVVISTFQPIIDWENKKFQCGTVTVSVLEPIESENHCVDDLVAVAYRKMDDEYLRLNAFMNVFNRSNSKDN